MFPSLKTFAVATMIGMTGLAGFAPMAGAEPIELSLRSGPVIDVQYRDERDWRRGHDRHRPDVRRDGRGRCSPWLAADKAGAYGLRRARVVDVTPRRVVVEGRRHGGFRTVVFANVRGCPVLGR